MESDEAREREGEGERERKRERERARQRQRECVVRDMMNRMNRGAAALRVQVASLTREGESGARYLWPRVTFWSLVAASVSRRCRNAARPKCPRVVLCMQRKRLLE